MPLVIRKMSAQMRVIWRVICDLMFGYDTWVTYGGNVIIEHVVFRSVVLCVCFLRVFNDMRWWCNNFRRVLYTVFGRYTVFGALQKQVVWWPGTGPGHFTRD